MAGFFISYSRDDFDVAIELHRRLEAAGYANPFLDQHPGDGIPLGGDWEATLRRELGSTAAVLFLSSPTARASQWCREEVELALTNHRPVHEIKIDDGDEWFELLDDRAQKIRLDRARETSWNGLLTALRSRYDHIGYSLLEEAEAWQRGDGPPRRGERLLQALRWRARAADVEPQIDALLVASRRMAADALSERVRTERLADASRIADREAAVLLALAAIDAYGRTDHLDTTLRAAVAACVEHGFRSLEWDVMAAAFSPDGVHLAISDTIDMVRLVDVATGAMIWEAEPTRREGEYLAGARALAFSADGATLASAHDEFVALWRTGDGTELAQVPIADAKAIRFEGDQVVAAEDTDASGVVVGPLGVRAAPGEYHGFDLWPARDRTGAVHCADAAGVSAIGWDAEGELLAGLDRDGRAHVWSAATGELIRSLPAEAAPARAVALGSAGRLLLTGTQAGELLAWEPGAEAGVLLWQADHAAVRSIVVLDRQTVRVADDTGRAVLVDPTTGGLRGPAAHHDVSTDGTLGAIATLEYLDSGVAVLDLSSGTTLVEIDHFGDQDTIQFWPGRRELLVCQENAATLLDVESGVHVHRWGGHPDRPVTAAAASPQGDRIALATSEGMAIEPIDFSGGATVLAGRRLTTRQLTAAERREHGLPDSDLPLPPGAEASPADAETHVTARSTERIDVLLVAGGRYHDIDYARRELLRHLAEHDHVRTIVDSTYENTDALQRCSLLVSYTCDVRPSEEAQAAVRSWVERGGRWLALHGTNAALDLPRPNGVEAPRCFPTWVDTLGSQFIAHPPIRPYTVEVTDPDHWLVAGIGDFETDDELYCMEHADEGALRPLLHTTWTGEATGFAEADWSGGTGRRLVQYLRPLGEGAVLYNTLGHCRGHWDMQPLVDYYPRIERCSWEAPQYHELLRRAIRWGLGGRS